MTKLTVRQLIGILCCIPVFCHASSLSHLTAELEAIRHKHDVPATGVLIVKPDELVLSKVWGLADVASKRPATEDTIFRIGSITKAFTSLTFLALDEKGLLPINTELNHSLGSLPLKNHWEKTHPVTLEMLLEHTAGLLDLSKPEWDYSDQKPLSLNQAFRIDPSSRNTQWQPGMYTSYSNSGAGIAAWVAEKKLNQNFEQMMQEHVFKPLGMYDATLYKTPQVERNLATGYQADGRTVIPYWNMIYRPFGAMNIRLKDMQAFLQLLLNRGQHKGRQIFSRASIKRMEIPHTNAAAKTGLSFGYGLGNYQWYRNGYLFHGHGGDGDGYLAHFGYSTELKMGYCLLINSFNHRPLVEMRKAIENYMLLSLIHISEPTRPY